MPLCGNICDYSLQVMNHLFNIFSPERQVTTANESYDETEEGLLSPSLYMLHLHMISIKSGIQT